MHFVHPAASFELSLRRTHQVARPHTPFLCAGSGAARQSLYFSGSSDGGRPAHWHRFSWSMMLLRQTGASWVWLEFENHLQHNIVRNRVTVSQTDNKEEEMIRVTTGANEKNIWQLYKNRHVPLYWHKPKQKKSMNSPLICEMIWTQYSQCWPGAKPSVIIAKV